MIHRISRRNFLQTAAAVAGSGMAKYAQANGKLEFEISLVESSLAHSLKEKALDHLGIAGVARNDLQIEAIEYASVFFKGRVDDEKYLDEMNKHAADHGVRQLLILVDDEGRIGDAVAENRKTAIGKHCRWLDAAKALGCHSIQVNPESSGTRDEQSKRAVDSLYELCAYAAKRKINVVLGNYGGPSADAVWVGEVLKAVDKACCGTLPHIGQLKHKADFANLATLLSFAKGITANTWDFDKNGNEKNTDYFAAMKVVRQVGYKGYVGINYHGTQLDELAGIRATKKLLETVRAVMK